MEKQQFDQLCEVTPEKASWLKSVAETHLAHMEFCQAMPEGQLMPADEGLLEAGRAFLYVYGLAMKAGVVPAPNAVPINSGGTH